MNETTMRSGGRNRSRRGLGFGCLLAVVPALDALAADLLPQIATAERGASDTAAATSSGRASAFCARTPVKATMGRSDPILDREF